MTITIPKWVLVALLLAAVAVFARFVFRATSGTSSRKIVLAGNVPSYLGGLAVQTASLPAAIDTFGVPSAFHRDSEVCPAQWRDLGLEIYFVNLGGDNPCGWKGAVGSAAVGGFEGEQAGWQTDQGATIGVSQEKLFDLYPKMIPGPLHSSAIDVPFPGRPFYLVSRPSVIGSTGSTPSLVARLDREPQPLTNCMLVLAGSS